MYETSEKWKQNIYENTVCAMNIYIDDVLVNPDYILDFKKGGNAFEEEFCLGGTPSQYVEMKLYKDKMPESLKKIRVEYGILINHALTVAEVNAMLVGTLNGIPVKSLSSNDSSFEMIPIGIYNVDDYTDNDDNTITIKALDNMIKFEFNYDGSELISKGEATLLEVAQDICKKAGVELNSTSFLNSDKKVAVYDNTVTARKYISYIAESAGGFACIDRKGKLCFRKFYQDETEIPLEIFGEYKWGEEFKISKVSYEDGIRSFKFGDDTRNNLWINQENMYIVDEDQVKKIYNEIKDLTSNTFEGKTVIDPAIDLGDKIVIDGKNVIYQGEMSLEGSFIAQISSKIQIKQKEETTVKKESQKVVNRKVQSRIDQAEGKIEQLVEETSDQSQKLTKVEQTVDSISQKVSDIEDLTQTTEGIKTVALANCIEGNLLELHIYGNNTVFNYLLLDDKLTLNDNLYLEGDDLIRVTDKDNNIKTYSLGITEALRQNNEVCDEFVLENGQAKVIRRVNKSGLTKAKESVENLGKLEISLKEGTNTITINNYTAKIKAKYVIKSAYSDTFATKVEMNSEIKQTKESIDLSVNKKLEDYSTTDEMNSAIKLKTDSIATEVSKKVGKTEVGTYIEQNVDAIKYAWNQISEFIQMMIINNNASFAILDQNKKVLMALDKTGQHFYKNDGSTVFGEMGVNKEDSNSYISFAVDGEYNKDITDGMAWGIKTRSDNKYHPILYIKNFHMGAKNSDDVYGQLVLKYCDLILEGMETGIQSGNVRFYGNVFSGITFEDTNSGSGLLNIYPANSMISGAENGGLAILDNITLFKNASGSNSFKISSGNNNYVILTDNGDITALGGNVILGNNNNKIGFSVTASTAYFWGDVNVNGNIYANNLSSDVRIKENIKDSTDSALDIINKIQHKEFDKKDDGRHYKIGYIAQEMEKIDPNFVIKRPEDKEKNIEERYYINELPIIATLTKAIQEQQKQIEELKNKISKLEEVNNE